MSKATTKNGKVLLLSVVLLAMMIGASQVQAGPKNIIFFIGDGMGFEQVKAGGMYLNGEAGTLSFEGFPYQGEITTYSADDPVTDSAAGGTALATGVKVNNDVISMAKDEFNNDIELLTLLEDAQAQGKSVGLITTAYLTHATPAVFGAHEWSRSNYSAIATDYLTQTLPNVLFGGGGNGLTLDSTLAAGYTVTDNAIGFQSLDFAPDGDPYTDEYFSAQFGSGYMPYKEDYLSGTYPDPFLDEMVAKAIEILSEDPDGFFLMVEGARVDHACHSNLIEECVHEVIDFSNAVETGYNWASSRSDTLILVTADHETGGLTVITNNGAGSYPSVTWSTTGHTAANVPVYAWGVNAELISGVMDNTDMFGVVTLSLVAGNPSPADGAVDVSPALVNLIATVNNPGGTADPVDVTFYGHEKPFTIVAIGDTQNYTQSGTAAIYDAMTQWIVDNAVEQNIVFVTHQGDIVDAWDNSTEWTRARDSMNILDIAGIPYGVLPGNHDKEDYTNDATLFNETFHYNQFEIQPWYGGHYGTTNNNNYQLFSAGGDDYIVLHIEDYPDDGAVGAVIGWADSVLTTYSDRKAIITTHGYMTTSGAYSGKWGPTQYIRDTLVEAHDNVYFVLCGHSGEYTKTTTVGTRDVHELLSCYHADGWLRIMQFFPANDAVYVYTYSPWLDLYQTDDNSEFTLDFPMSGSDFTLIDSAVGVPSGSDASVEWSGLAVDTQYEWYVTVADTVTPAIMAGPVWDFTTASFKASNPNPANGATDVDVDADLSWSAGVDAVRHDVYFGTDPDNLPLVSALQGGTTYEPGTLQEGTTYYWAIDEHDSEGGEGGVVYGYVWSFTTTFPQPVAIVSAGSDWKYFDQVDSDQGAWYDPSFDDISWAEGPAELGYGDGDEATVIDGSPVRASYYFRRTFTAAEAYDNLVLNVVRDDGCVVYLNGVEIGRSNMPAGDILWNTWAAAVTTNENDWWGISVDPLVSIQPGVNVLAVSVHQAHSTSSDVSFDLELLGVVAPGQPVANDDSDTTDEDTPVTIDVLANDTDPEQDPLSVASVTQPANGSVVNNGSDVTYTPDPDFSGTDTFTYVATNGANNSNAATVTVTIISINDPPGVPQNLSVVAGDGVVSLDWDDNVEQEGDLAGYNIYRSQTPGSYDFGSPLANVTVSAYTDNTVVNDTTYYYVVKAVDNGLLESTAASNEVSATPAETAYDAYVIGEPIVTFGEVVGTIQGTIEAGDGLVQEITEVPDGHPLNGSLQAEYVLHTTANRTDITGLTVHLGLTWTALDAGDPLIIGIWNGTEWTNITGSIGGSYTPSNPQDYVDAGGDIRVRFTDTQAVKKENKDTLTVDLLYAQISAGPVNAAPSVDITAPVEGAEFTEGDSITITAVASDSDGTVTKAEFYQDGIYLGEDTTSPYSYTWNNVPSGSYSLTAKATDNGDATTTSAPVNITVTDTTAPAAPTSLAATAVSDTQIDLDWADNAEPDFSHYNVYRSTASGGSYAQIASDVMVSNYSDTSLTASTTYYYVARAVDTSSNESVNSSEASATTKPPNVPPSVTITSPTDGATFSEGDDITIQADASDSDGTVTKVEFYQNGIYLGEDTTSPYSYTWNSVPSGSYSLTAKATDDAGAATTSGPVNITVTDTTAPAAPTGLAATAGDGQVSLDWDDNTELDLAGYNVYRSETEGGPYTQIATLPATSNYLDLSVVNETTYYYVVTAVDMGSNESGYIGEVSATPTAQVSDVVTIVRADYRIRQKAFTVRATSTQGGVAVLTVVGYGTMTYDVEENLYTFRETVATDPGDTIEVVSDLGGSDIASITRK